MSAVAKKIAGTYVADDTSEKPPVAAWFQHELREGRFRKLLDRFIKAQPEFLDPHLILVESVTAEAVLCRIPCRLYDHESAGTFFSQVALSMNPQTKALVRLP